MTMNTDDKRRYAYLRTLFDRLAIDSDGWYTPWFRSGSLKRASSLEESIDLAMGMTPTHEKPEEMVPLSLCVSIVMESAIGIKPWGPNPEMYTPHTSHCVDVGGVEIVEETLEELRVVVEAAIRELVKECTR